MPVRLSTREFCKIARRVVRELPSPFLPWMENVAIDVRRAPSKKLAAEMGLGPDDEPLLGLFLGQPIDEQEYGVRDWNSILLFQRPHEDVCESLEELEFEIRRTVLHELAHHFGYSEEDLEDFESRGFVPE